VVVAVDRGRFRCRVEGQSAQVSAIMARSLPRLSVIVGDQVRVVGDTSGDEGALARIVEVTPRTTVLRRTADDDDPYERPIVANADQLAIVAALADPPPRVGMIDRILVAAFDAGLEPLLVLTKSDLAAPDGLMATYRPLGVKVVAIEPGADLSELRAALTGRRSVLVGHSGVGKSTLVNALIPGVDRAIGEVNEVTGRGRHTSTSAVALELPAPGGWVIDTPGVRSFGLSHITPESFVAAFSDLADLVEQCPRGCRHDSSAPECALDEAVARGELTAERLESFRRMERAFG
jgi:ribosome biogenesis GTPase / thiamine phosphate phosphatase